MPIYILHYTLVDKILAFIMLKHEKNLLLCLYFIGGKTTSDISDYEYPIDIDSEPNNDYKFAVEEVTGVRIPLPGQKRLSEMADDGTIQTPNGIRYKIVNTKDIPSIEYIQYVQPDGKHASPGEAIKLQNGEIYRGKGGRILYQQEPIRLTYEQSQTNSVKIGLEFNSIDDIDFDFGYNAENMDIEVNIPSSIEEINSKFTDGTKILSDGTILLNDGTQMMPNGDVIRPDGSIVSDSVEL
jgi:hypothetical protein